MCAIVLAMIRTLADDATRDIWNGVNSKAARRIPRELWPIVHRKLDQIDAVTRLEDLKVPPGNRLHALGGDIARLARRARERSVSNRVPLRRR